MMGTLRTARLVAMLLVLGLAPAAPSGLYAASAPATDVLHEVLPGDCLHLIAGYYYGDARLWDRIWKANQAILRSPHQIPVGTYLLVPNAGLTPGPYPDFTARAIGCGPGMAGSASQPTKAQAEAAPATPTSPSKAQ